MIGKFVGIHARKYSGKTEVAKVFRMHDFQVVKMADTLKNMTRILLSDAGFNSSEIEDLIEGPKDKKEMPIEILGGSSSRNIMETLGTEWRNMHSKTLWVDIAKTKIRNLMLSGQNVVCDDIRFSHEIETLTSFLPNSDFIKIVRPSLPELVNPHPSEIPLDDIFFSKIIMNDGAIEDLNYHVVDYLDNKLEYTF